MSDYLTWLGMHIAALFLFTFPILLGLNYFITGGADIGDTLLYGFIGWAIVMAFFHITRAWE